MEKKIIVAFVLLLILFVGMQLWGYHMLLGSGF
jgi:hypothetical protein